MQNEKHDNIKQRLVDASSNNIKILLHELNTREIIEPSVELSLAWQDILANEM